MRAFLWLACLGAVVLALGNPTAEPGDALWQAAVETVSNAEVIVPQRVTLQFMGRDPSTGTICRRDGQLTVKGKTPEGEIDWDAVYTEDIVGLPPEGDVDCEFGPQVQGKLPLPGFDCSPLMSRYRDGVSYEATDLHRRIEDVECVVYTFTWKRSCFGKKKTAGQVCLDPLSGSPVEVRYEYRRVPAGIRSAVAILRYRSLGELGPHPVSFAIEMLSKKGEFADQPYRITGEFHDYARMEP